MAKVTNVSCLVKTSGIGPKCKLLREGQVDPNGLISHLEGGALPPPATSFRILTANQNKLFIWKKAKADPVEFDR